ncbi:MAG: hypothetical protein U1F27_01030 [Turneriella sp.]
MELELPRRQRRDAGRKPILVIEADESDRSFLSIAAQAALITNIDLDHTDVHVPALKPSRRILSSSLPAR